MSGFLRAAGFAAFIGLFVVPLAPTPADAARLTSVKVSEASKLPVIRPDWPIPNEPNQVFYLQRSLNSNTVVFTALFDGNGILKKKRPAQVYWRRYNTTGERKPLKVIEQRFAYGMNMSRGDVAGEYDVSLKPLPDFRMRLVQKGPGKAELLTRIGGRDARAVYAFVTVDDTGLIPKVIALSVHGIDLATGRAISETFSVVGAPVDKQ